MDCRELMQHADQDDLLPDPVNLVPSAASHPSRAPFLSSIEGLVCGASLQVPRSKVTHGVERNIIRCVTSLRLGRVDETLLSLVQRRKMHSPLQSSSRLTINRSAAFFFFFFFFITGLGCGQVLTSWPISSCIYPYLVHCYTALDVANKLMREALCYYDIDIYL